MNTSKPNPCKDCELRAIGCHSDCSDYKEWRTELDRKNAQIHKSKQMYNLIERNPQVEKYAKRRRNWK